MTQPRRKQLRVPGYDYSTPGSYFITVCASDRSDRFGEIEDGVLASSPAGAMLSAQWQALGIRFPDIAVDAFVAMPDHVHGFLWLGANEYTGQPAFLGRVVQAFKSITTREYMTGVRTEGWQSFQGRLWQANYYPVGRVS